VNTPLSDARASSRFPVPGGRERTYFAPAGRDSPDEFRRRTAVIHAAPLLGQVLEAIPAMVMVLNMRRQIVVANSALLTVLRTSLAEVVEKRPGEAVGCIRAQEGPDGCGTARHCATCGAVNAILESQKGEAQVVRECRILVATPSGIASMDLKVTATPFRIADERFIVAVVEDVSQPKRLAVLQRVFFHDVLNTAGCVLGYAQCFRGDGEIDAEVRERLADLADQLIELIQAQRDLMFAESGDLFVQRAPVRTTALLDDLRLEYAKHPAAEGRVIERGTVWDGAIITDRQLLKRVLGNMVKNALEATPAGGKVTLSADDHGDTLALAVHNPGVMPEEVQLQIFQRSFSTKGQSGRGIGTYSMKLLGEQYLGGKVEFTSSPDEGTTFTLTIPKVLNPS
jgi:nitrogen-specific signal transduction histidine kinase